MSSPEIVAISRNRPRLKSLTMHWARQILPADAVSDVSDSSRLKQFKVQLMSGECVDFPGSAEKVIITAHRVAWQLAGYRSAGSLLLTNFRVALLHGPFIAGVTDRRLDLDIPMGVISSVRRLSRAAKLRTASGDCRHDVVEISCHDFRTVQLCSLEGESLVELEKRIKKLLAEAYDHSLSAHFVRMCGQTSFWLASPWQQEFNRMGVDDQWRRCDVNSSYSVCSSYPSCWYVPAAASDETVLNSVAFRSGGRCPILTWRHSKRGSLLLRCAQPKVGLWEDDLNREGDAGLLEASRRCAGENARLTFFDCRSKTVAHANALKKGGTESRDWYTWTDETGQQINAQMLELEVDNIHAMRASWQALKRLVDSKHSENDWLTKLDDTRWLHHCRRIAEGALTVARCLNGRTKTTDEPASVVVVHCSEGWDRTTQVCSLAQLLLDSYYRTYSGLCTLIEKDWMCFGHRFHDRVHGSKPNKQAPIFLQWVFCIDFIRTQFPDNFAYSCEDLMLLVDLWMSGWTGTVQGNSEQDRIGNSDIHVSLWSVWLASIHTYKEDVKIKSFETEDTSFEGYDALRDQSSLAFALSNEPISDRFGGTLAQTITLLRPVVSVKCLKLWPWVLRFDEFVIGQMNDCYPSGLLWPPQCVWLLQEKGFPRCDYCRRDFWQARWRHHCHACGRIFCGADTCLTTAQLPSLGYDRKVYICHQCKQNKENDERTDNVRPQMSDVSPTTRKSLFGRRVLFQELVVETHEEHEGHVISNLMGKLLRKMSSSLCCVELRPGSGSGYAVKCRPPQDSPHAKKLPSSTELIDI